MILAVNPHRRRLLPQPQLLPHHQVRLPRQMGRQAEVEGAEAMLDSSLSVTVDLVTKELTQVTPGRASLCLLSTQCLGQSTSS